MQVHYIVHNIYIHVHVYWNACIVHSLIRQLEDEAISTVVDQSRITPPPQDGTDLPKLHIPRLRQLSSSESECPPSSPIRAG